MAAELVNFYRNYNNSDITNQVIPLTTYPASIWDAPEGKRFKEWNTLNDGSGIGHSPGESYSNDAFAYYAIWEEQEYVEYITDNIQLTSIADAIRAKGGTFASLVYPNGFISAIDAIELGIDTSDANATASDMLSGKTAYVNGSKVTGNIPSKSSANLTASGATVTAPAGYYSTAAIKTIGSGSTTQNAPTVNSSTGLVTATATITAGYQAADTKSNTLQLTTQAAQTITPGTTNQTIAAGKYLTGAQTIKGDANLTAENIAQGVSIFGVTGTHSGGGGGGGADPTDFIENHDIWTSYTNLGASKIAKGAFYSCTSLTSISFPACTAIGDFAFVYCTSLTSISFPSCTTIGSNAFSTCSGLVNLSFPSCTTIGKFAFAYCTRLTTVSFPSCTTIGSYAFQKCYKLISLYLTGSSYVALARSNAFSSNPIGGYSASAGRYGSIYVPASMLSNYKTRTNWTYFSSRFVGV